jgi:hypothetical protein
LNIFLSKVIIVLERTELDIIKAPPIQLPTEHAADAHSRNVSVLSHNLLRCANIGDG